MWGPRSGNRPDFSFQRPPLSSDQVNRGSMAYHRQGGSASARARITYCLNTRLPSVRGVPVRGRPASSHRRSIINVSHRVYRHWGYNRVIKTYSVIAVSAGGNRAGGGKGGMVAIDGSDA